MNDEQLSGGHIVSLYKDKSFEVLKIERNVRLAVFLRNKDYIKDITIECLLDDNRIHWYIVDYLYKLYDFFDEATEYLIEYALEREFHPNEESYKQREAVVRGLEEQHILSKVCDDQLDAVIRKLEEQRTLSKMCDKQRDSVAVPTSLALQCINTMIAKPRSHNIRHYAPIN
ncbi:MAG: hypothetical protein PG981_000163 [Wolbachia endosymbiont of Ctenocephalides orientis wCori]|nr:MAG: hypothetical protein PG981_000163 [Wolbachia endosymbiont of Ctenocephalides orientis wCori]